MNEEYLQNLHNHLGIEDDYDTWVSSVKDNEEYLRGLHKHIGVTDTYENWNSAIFGGVKKKDQPDPSLDGESGTSDVEDGGLASSEIPNENLGIPTAEEIPEYKLDGNPINANSLMMFVDDPNFIDSYINGDTQLYIKNSPSLQKYLDDKVKVRKLEIENASKSKEELLSEDSDLEKTEIHKPYLQEKPEERSVRHKNTYGAELKVDPQEVYDYLTEKKGMTNAQAKGILANIMSESTFDPSAVGDNGASYGLFQHNLTRRDAMVKFINDNYDDKDWQTNWRGQIDYALTESDMANYLAATKDKGEKEAARLFMLGFERPADQSEEKQLGRISNLDKFQFGTVPKKEGPRSMIYNNVAEQLIPTEQNNMIENNFTDHAIEKLKKTESKNPVVDFLDVMFQGETPTKEQIAQYQEYIKQNDLDSSLDIQQIINQYQGSKELQQYSYINDPNYPVPEYIQKNPKLKAAYYNRKDFPFLPKDINNKLNNFNNGYEESETLKFSSKDLGKNYNLDTEGLGNMYTFEEKAFLEDIHAKLNPYRIGIENALGGQDPSLFATMEGDEEYSARKKKIWSKISDEDKIRYFELKSKPRVLLNEKLDNGWSHVGNGKYLHIQSGVVLSPGENGVNPLIEENGLKASIVEKMHKNPEFFKNSTNDQILAFYAQIFPKEADWMNQKIATLQERAKEKPTLWNQIWAFDNDSLFPSKDELQQDRQQLADVTEGDYKSKVSSLIYSMLKDVHKDVDGWANQVDFYKDADNAFDKLFTAREWMDNQIKLMDRYPKKANGDPDFDIMTDTQKNNYIDLHNAYKKVYDGAYKKGSDEAESFQQNPLYKVIDSINATSNRIVKFNADISEDHKLREIYLTNQKEKQAKVDKIQKEGGLAKHLHNAGNVVENTFLKFYKGAGGIPLRLKGMFTDEENYDYTDRLVDEIAFEVDKHEWKTPTELSQSWEYNEATVDGYRVMVDNKGEILNILTQDWEQVPNQEVFDGVKEKYENNPDDYQTTKKKNNKAFWHQALQSGIDLVADMAVTRRIAPLATSAKAKKIAGYGTMMGLYNLKQYEEFRQKALEQGMTQSEANDYANVVASVVSVTQAINPNLNAFKIPAAMTSKTAFRASLNDIGWGGIMKATLLKGLPKAAIEGGLEGLQELAELETERLLNGTLYNSYDFDLDRDMSEYKQSFITGAMLGGMPDVMATGKEAIQNTFTNGGRSRMRLQGLQYSYENRDEFYESILSRVDKKTSINGETVVLTKAQADEKIQHFKNLFTQVDRIVNQAKSNGVELDSDQIQALVGLQHDKNGLLNRQGDADPDIQMRVKNTIADIDNKINRIAQGENLVDVLKKDPEFNLGENIDEANLSTPARYALNKKKNNQEWSDVEKEDVVYGLESSIEKLENKENLTPEEASLLNVYKELLSDVKSIKPTINEKRNREDDEIINKSRKGRGRTTTMAEGKTKTPGRRNKVKSVTEADGSTSTVITTKGGKTLKVKQNGNISVEGGADSSIAGVILDEDGNVDSIVLSDPANLRSVKNRVTRLRKKLESGEITQAEFDDQIRQMPGASLLTDPDLTTQAAIQDVTSKLIKSGKINEISSKKVDEIIEEESQKQSEQKQKSTKGVFEWFKSIFRARSYLPYDLFIRKRALKGRMAEWQNKLDIAQQRFIDAMEAHKERFGGKSLTMKQIVEAFTDSSNRVNDLAQEIAALKINLEGSNSKIEKNDIRSKIKVLEAEIKRIAKENKGKFTMGDLLKVDKNLYDSLSNNRELLDEMSRALIKYGIAPADIQKTIQENIGSYLTTQYRTHHDSEYQSLMSNLSEKLLNEKLSRKDKEKYIKEINILQKAHNLAWQKITDQYKRDRSRHIKKYPYLVSASGEPINGRDKNTNAQVVAPRYPDKQEILNKIDAWLGINDKDSNYSLLKENISADHIFNHRKDLPDIIVELMGGKIDDPLFNMVNTGMNLAKSLEINSYRQDVVDTLLGKALFTQKTGDANAEVVIGDVVYYTYPEMANEIESMESLMTMSFRQMMQNPVGKYTVGTYLKFLSLVKAGKTIYSFPTHARNFTSNLGFAIANGHINPITMIKSWGIASQEFGMKSDPEKQRAYQTMLRYGVIQSSDLDEMNALLDLAGDQGFTRAILDPKSLSDSEWKKMRKKYGKTWIGKIKGTLSTANRKIHAAYRFEDTFWKVNGFLHEVGRYQNAGYSYQEALDKAGEITINTYPTYDMLPPLFKAFRAAPMVGTFVSFPAEVIRTSYNTAGIAMKELLDPKTRVIGAKRLSGILTKAIGFKWFAKYLVDGLGWAGALFGGDDDDEDKRMINIDMGEENMRKQNYIRLLAPKWHKYSQIALLNETQPGVHYYWSIFDNDPHGYLGEVLNAAVGEVNRKKLDKWKEKYRKGEIGLEEYLKYEKQYQNVYINKKDPVTDLIGMNPILHSVLEPFIGRDILFSAVTDWANNRDGESGRPIYNEDTDKGWEKQKKMFQHFTKKVQPSMLQQSARLLAAMNPDYAKKLDKYQPFYSSDEKLASVDLSRDYDLGYEALAFLTGLRVSKLDSRDAFKYNMMRANSELKDALGDVYSSKPEDVLNRAKEILDHMEGMFEAARELGIEEAQVAVVSHKDENGEDVLMYKGPHEGVSTVNREAIMRDIRLDPMAQQLLTRDRFHHPFLETWLIRQYLKQRQKDALNRKERELQNQES